MTIIAGAVMIGSTLGFAAASVGTDNVFGDNTNIVAPGSLDAGARVNLQDYMASLNINETVITNGIITEGEIAAIKTSSQPLYLGDVMYDTKSTFTETQLPTVLASGEVDGDDGKDYDYDLKIDVPNSETKYGEPEDGEDNAIIYTDFSGEQNYKLRIIFPTAVDVNELAGEEITLFGREFTFSEDEGDLSIESIDLFEKSTMVTINSGETKFVEGHSIRVDVEDTNSATIYVDGISKNVNDEDWSGKIGGVNVYVKNIHAPNVEGLARYVQISLNAEKLTLSDGDEVERGTSSIDGTNVEIKPSGNKVKEIVITVTPSEFDDEVEHLAIGDYIIDPVFKTIKFSLDSVTPDLKSDDRDYIKVKTSGDEDASISFKNKAGKEYSFEFIDNNEVTFLKENIPEDGYFITGNNEYTQIWRVENIKVDGNEKEIRLRDQAKDSDSIEIKFDGAEGEFTLADGSVAKISGVTSTKIEVSNIVDYVYTDNGAKITFDFDGVKTTTTKVYEKYQPGTVNFEECVLMEPITYDIYETDSSGSSEFMGNSTVEGYYVCEDYSTDLDDPNNYTEVTNTEVDDARIIIEEETKYNGGSFTDNDGAQLGSEIIIEIKNLDNEDDLELKLLGSSYIDDDNKYLTTRYGTYVTENDGERIEIYYPEEAMSIDFHIGEVTSSITSQQVASEGEVSRVIIGGSCINSAAASLLGSSTPICGADFTTATGVGVGQAMVQTFADSNGKVAILVAGYETADTARAVQYLIDNQGYIDFTVVGTRKIV